MRELTPTTPQPGHVKCPMLTRRVGIRFILSFPTPCSDDVLLVCSFRRFLRHPWDEWRGGHTLYS